MSVGHVNVVEKNGDFIFNFEYPIASSRFDTEFEFGWEEKLKDSNLPAPVKKFIVSLSSIDDGVLNVFLAPKVLVLKTTNAFDLEVTQRHLAATVGADSFTPSVRGKMSVH